MTTAHNMNRMLAARLAERTGLSVSIVNVGGGCPVIEARMPGTTLGVGPHVLILKPTDIDLPLDERGRYADGVTVLAHVDADDATPDEMLTIDGPHALHVGAPAVTDGVTRVLTAWRDDQAAQQRLASAPDQIAAALAELADVFGDLWTASDTGSHMTCSEANALAKVLALAGHRDAAARWLMGHATGDDDDDDQHCELATGEHDSRVSADIAEDLARAAAVAYVAQLVGE